MNGQVVGMDTNSIRWRRTIAGSLLGYARDVLIALLPLRRLPRLLRVALLGVDAQFVFLVHPRRKEDIFIAWPFAWPFRVLFRKKFYLWLRYLPPTVLDVIRTPAGVSGVVVSSTWLPEILIQRRKAALKEARRCVRFASKLSGRDSFLGLGEWWPFLTRRAEGIREYALSHGLRVTSGYTGTLCSVKLSIDQIASIGGVAPSELKVLILGVGKMGASVAKSLLNDVARVTFYDKNKAKQARLASELSAGARTTVVDTVESQDQLGRAISEHDICVCTTSNIRRILRPEDIPDCAIVLDDSRPEAFPRIYDDKRGIVVLEGGLLKVPGLKMTYDFGFGNHDEVFGCLAEAYMLAKDAGESLNPTVGDIDPDNYRRMMALRDKCGVKPGGFRSGSFLVNPAHIAAIIRRKHSVEAVSAALREPGKS